MNSWLEAEGAKAVIAKAKAALTRAVNNINTHTTNEMRKIMSELARLSEAVTKELADDAAQNQLIASLQALLAEANAATAAALAGEAQAQADLQAALAAASEAADRLASNDPVEPPVEEPVPVDPGDPGLGAGVDENPPV